MIVVKLTPARVALLIAAFLAIAAGASYAAIPSANGTISACVKQNGEIQKLMDTEAGDTCTGSNKKVVTWSQQGPAGPQGAPGLSGYQIVHVLSADSSADHKQTGAFCPAGKKALGGGGQAALQNGNNVNAYYNANFVISVPVANGWVVEAGEITPDSASWWVDAYVICATVAS